MIIHGRNILIYQDGVGIAAAKSCEIHVQCEKIEVASAQFGDWKDYIAGIRSWNVRLTSLLLSVDSHILSCGSRVRLTLIVTDNLGRDTGDILIGDAMYIGCTLSGQIGHLANGSFSLDGDGPLVKKIYERLEYVDNTNGAYILTDVIPDRNTGYYMDAIDTSNNRYRTFIGTNSYMSRIFSSSGRLQVLFLSQTFYATSGSVRNQRLKIHCNYLNDKKYILNGAYVATLTGTGTITNAIAIGYQSATGNVMSGRIYDVAITRADNIIRHYIPARRISDGVVGMYDIIMGVFHVSHNSSTFIAGPVINDIIL